MSSAGASPVEDDDGESFDDSEDLVLDTPDPPSDLPYAEFEDYRAAELLRVNGIEPSLSGALETLERGELLLRGAAAHVLGSLGDAAAMPQLRRVADTSDDVVKAESAFALVRLGDDAYRDVLKQCLEYPLTAYVSPSVAAGMLARLGDPSGILVVTQALEVDNLIARVVACKQIAFFVPLNGERVNDVAVDAYALFERALHDAHPEIHRIALLQLREFRTEASRQLLRQYLPIAPDEYLRQAAEQALQSL